MGKMIEYTNHCLNEETIRQIADKLLLEIESMDDKEKAILKEKIREEIYRNRYYNTSEWAMKDEEISILEETLTQIQFDNPIYEYRYLFKYRYDFPVMNPCPFDNTSHFDKNKELAEFEIKQGIKRLLIEGYDPFELVKICAECNYPTLGKYLFSFISENRFDVDLYKRMLIDANVISIMLDYVSAAYQYSYENLQQAYYIAKEHNVKDEILAQILLLENLNINSHPLVLEADEGVKKLYWKSFRGGHLISNIEAAHVAINEMLLYSDQMCILEMLDSCEDYITEEEMLSTLEKSKNLDAGNVCSTSRYHVDKIIAILQKAYIDTDECIRVAMLELYYHDLVRDNNMRCFNKCLSDSPALLLQMLSLLFKTDEGNIVEGVVIDENKTSGIFSIYYGLKFCPAVNNGKVDPDKLDKWMSDFEIGLKKNNQSRLFDPVIGKLFSYSPIGKDGLFPAEELRCIIERRHSKELKNAYATAVFNSRGVYSITGGEAERKLALGYKENADKLRVSYPITADIYDYLYKWYLREADSERERDEYAGI